MKSWAAINFLLAFLTLTKNSNNARGTECNIASRMKVAVTGKTGANLMAGTLSFYNGSSWRDVCGSNWDIKYAKVLCKELGFPQEGAEFYNNSCYSTNPSSQGVTDFQCQGNETRLGDCNYRTVDSCKGNNYAGVICMQALNINQQIIVIRVLGVVSSILFFTLVGVVMGWVWFCHRNKGAPKQRNDTNTRIQNFDNPNYVLTIPSTTPSIQFSSLESQDTPIPSHSPGKKEGMYQSLGAQDIKRAQYEVATPVRRERSAVRAATHT